MNRALRRVALACLVMFLLLLANANFVQVFQASNLASDPGNVRTSIERYQYQRGSILTSDGKVIAESVPVKGGVYSYQRHYPDGKAYAPVTGYDPINGTGAGIELAENKLLSGNDPALAVHNLVDLITGKPKKGATVQLTINSHAQQAAYAALAATGRQSGVVAMNPRTGAILALASYPTYNPNKLATLNGSKFNKIDSRYLRDPKQPMVNKALDALYPPGSTFKVVTGSAALATGRYQPTTPVYAPTYLKMPGTSKKLVNYDNLPCDNGSNPTGNGKVPLIFAFAVSCNTVYGNIGMHLGGDTLAHQAAKFGVNDPSLRIPLPVTASQYHAVSSPPLTAYSAIGQYDDKVTALQEAMFAAAIANNGRLMAPYMIKKVTAPDLTPLDTASPKVLRQAVSARVAAQMKQMMIAVVKQPYGTAHATAGKSGLDIAAKTGTAQNGVNNSGLDDAMFTAFAPAGNPQIAVGVVVKGGGLGADASAPVAVKIIQAYLAAQAK